MVPLGIYTPKCQVKYDFSVAIGDALILLTTTDKSDQMFDRSNVERRRPCVPVCAVTSNMVRSNDRPTTDNGNLSNYLKLK